MKRIAYLLLAALLVLSMAVPAFGVNGQVTYSENAEKFIFLPGSDQSPTDLFPEFKDVMPGDTLAQRILVKNDPVNKCKVKLYMRALGAHPDSEEFLSQLKLTVLKNTDTVLFEASADETAQLTGWVYLGTLYSGGECELTAILEVPVTLENAFQAMAGYLDWEFAVEELPIEPSDPSNPETGDRADLTLWIALLALSAVALMALLLLKKKK